MFTQRDRFYEEREYYALNFFEDSYHLLAKDFSSADQIFVAKQEELKSVYIKFDITNLVNLDGTIHVSILDSNDDIVRTTIRHLDHLTQTESTQWTKFPLPATLKKGEQYTLHITVQKYKDDMDGSLALYTAYNKQGLFKDLLLDGKPSKKRMVATFKYNTYCIDDFYLMMLLLGLAGIFTLLYGYRIPGRSFRKINWGLVFMVLTPLVADYMMQSFCGYSVPDFFEQILSLAGLFNFLIYLACLLLFYLLTGSSRYSSLALMLLTYGAGLANYYVWSFRDCPIVAADLSSLRTAANVASGYNYSLGFYGSWGTVIFLVWCVLLLVAKPALPCQWKKRLALGLVGLTMTCGLWGLIFQSDYLGKHDIFVSIWMPQRNYAQNGCALSFFLTCSYYVVEKPDGYSQERVAEISKRYESDSATELSPGQTPNVIAIMNESLSDLAVAADIETSEDYMPFIHQLTENTIKGNLYVSVLGGNTANTEMEFQTGNTMAFFPSRSVPYNSYLRHKTGSFTWDLRNSGYASVHAVHPYYSNGWSREIVYPLLGFTDFISRDQFE
ncbi:MAG: hypothetical protein MJ097_04805, partial [Dorea sp.]|nr:hypothetical protein [Dorea sp.]